jgi:hypothetical protein
MHCPELCDCRVVPYLTEPDQKGKEHEKGSGVRNDAALPHTGYIEHDL